MYLDENYEKTRMSWLLHLHASELQIYVQMFCVNSARNVKSQQYNV